MERITITELDHIVLNVADIERSLDFYTGVLNLAAERVEEFRAGKVGFPSVRINGETLIDLFPTKPDSDPHSREKKLANLNHFCLVVGPADFTGITEYLASHKVAIREGPVARWGARGRATSVYFFDPDGNEIEIRCY